MRLTLAGLVTVEIPRVKGSRFIATAAPVASADAAAARLADARAAHPTASHTAYAWRIHGPSIAERASDDGEPSGTAGRPILQCLQGRGLTDVAVTVTRYFGGTKLGTGGLARAYGGAAATALEAASVVALVPIETWRVRCSYAALGAVQAAIAVLELVARDLEYAADVVLLVDVETPDAPAFVAAMREATAGRAEITHASEGLSARF